MNNELRVAPSSSPVVTEVLLPLKNGLSRVACCTARRFDAASSSDGSAWVIVGQHNAAARPVVARMHLNATALMVSTQSQRQTSVTGTRLFRLLPSAR